MCVTTRDPGPPPNSNVFSFVRVHDYYFFGLFLVDDEPVDRTSEEKLL